MESQSKAQLYYRAWLKVVYLVLTMGALMDDATKNLEACDFLAMHLLAMFCILSAK
jgi:hypothetical protein